MITTVKGLYEGGVKLLEPVKAAEHTEVIVMFLPSEKNEGKSLREVAGVWSDIDTEALKARLRESRAVSTRQEVIL